jgi:hypothetical protein
MSTFICCTCGVQYNESDRPRDECPICTDARQYVPAGGQSWTTHEGLARRYTNSYKLHEADLYGIGTVPQFGIGQRALLVRTEAGNILWDCLSLVDDATREIVTALGGIHGIAISHPHYYGSMVEWSRAFAGAPIYIHERDRQWVMRPDPSIIFWSGTTHQVSPEVTLIHCGGHFEGATVLHWAKGAEGRGCLMTGDVIMVTSDRKSVSFMRSYPNNIPLSADHVRHICDVTRPFAFERLYGPFFDRVISSQGRETLNRCATRYIDALSGRYPG